MNTTNAVETTKKLEDITFESIASAIKGIPKIKKVRMEASKKDMKAIRKAFPEGRLKNKGQSYVGELYGIPIRERKGLKKVRIYTEK